LNQARDFNPGLLLFRIDARENCPPETSMILITGATGTNGAEVVRQLSAAGIACRALVRNAAKAQALRMPGVEIVAGDLSDARSLDRPLAGVRRALLLSAPIPEQVSHERNFIEAAKRAGVWHVVKLSAFGADARSAARFLRNHAEAEKYLEDSGLAWTHVRPPFFMQNMLGLAGSIRATGKIFQPAGDGRAGDIDVRDIAAVLVAALTQPGHERQIYEITGPQSLSYAEIAQAFSRVLGRPIEFVNVPPVAARQEMLKLGMSAWVVDGILELMAALRDGFFDRVTPTVKQITGHPPRTLEQFLAEHVSQFR
jgi:uncharacterized protein YbjT (DUF2867 family)